MDGLEVLFKKKRVKQQFPDKIAKTIHNSVFTKINIKKRVSTHPVR